MKCGQDANFLGVVDVNIGFGSPFIERHFMIPVNESNLERDEDLWAIVKKWRKKFSEPGDEEILCRVIDVPLNTLTINLRQKETAFANAVADAMKMYIAQTFSDVLDPNRPILAIINGGFIRADNKYNVGGIILGLFLTPCDFRESREKLDLFEKH